MNNIDPKVINWLAKITNSDVQHPTIIQSLWSGYGACFSASLLNKEDRTPLPIVAKYVQATPTSLHPKGWQGKTSHQRKCHSFEVEQYFYTHLQQHTDEHCLTPNCLAADSHGDTRLIVMGDLNAAGYTQRSASLTLLQAQSVLSWLGAFHARFMGLSDAHVWPQGTYWHLDTRLDEYRAMAQGPLKEAAHTIADKLSSARFLTLLHGDAKVANFCFTPDYTYCGGVDFQYTGLGVGIKDVAYFIGSALSEEDQSRHTTHCLDSYFSALRLHLSHTHSKNSIQDIEQEWRALYPFACADFHRFLAGWSPEHWKINLQLSKQTAIALAALD